MTLEEAVAHFGSKAKLARALGIEPPSVSEWRKVPVGRQFQIQILTDGALVADPPARAPPGQQDAA